MKMNMKGKEKEVKEVKVKQQKGTGCHLDTNGYNPFVEEQDPFGINVLPLQKYMPIQAFVCLSSSSSSSSSSSKENKNLLLDGGLQIIPGFHIVCQKYFQVQGRSPKGKTSVIGRNLGRWGKYNTKFSKGFHSHLLENLITVGRIPEDWDYNSLKEINSKTLESLKTVEDFGNHITEVRKEISELGLGSLQAGDYVLWDNFIPHQTAEENMTETVRRTFYLTFIPDIDCNKNYLKTQRERRDKKLHPTDFEKTWEATEMDSEFKPLSQNQKLLWSYKEYEKTEEARKQRLEKIQEMFPLERKYIEFYKRYGFVVIPEVISKELVEGLNKAVDKYIERKTKIRLNNLEETFFGDEWKKISGVFGGMLNVFYLNEMEAIRERFECYAIVSQLLEETHSKGNLELFENPLGPYDSTCLHVRADRLNYRFPSHIIPLSSQKRGRVEHGNSNESKENNKKKLKKE